MRPTLFSTSCKYDCSAYLLEFHPRRRYIAAHRNQGTRLGSDKPRNCAAQPELLHAGAIRRGTSVKLEAKIVYSGSVQTLHIQSPTMASNDNARKTLQATSATTAVVPSSGAVGAVDVAASGAGKASSSPKKRRKNKSKKNKSRRKYLCKLFYYFLALIYS